MFLNRDFIFEEPIEFKTPNKYCPNIKLSCCKHSEIENLVNIFKFNIQRAESLYQNIQKTFDIFGDNFHHIEPILNEMTAKEE